MLYRTWNIWHSYIYWIIRDIIRQHVISLNKSLLSHLEIWDFDYSLSKLLRRRLKANKPTPTKLIATHHRSQELHCSNTNQQSIQSAPARMLAMPGSGKQEGQEFALRNLEIASTQKGSKPAGYQLHIRTDRPWYELPSALPTFVSTRTVSISTTDL